MEGARRGATADVHSIAVDVKALPAEEVAIERALDTLDLQLQPRLQQAKIDDRGEAMCRLDVSRERGAWIGRAHGRFVARRRRGFADRADKEGERPRIVRSDAQAAGDSLALQLVVVGVEIEVAIQNARDGAFGGRQRLLRQLAQLLGGNDVEAALADHYGITRRASRPRG